jgi:hypothetical protein
MSVTSCRPFANGIGSSNFRDYPFPVARGIVIVCKAAWQPWRSVFVAWIAVWTRHTGATALARMLAGPWSLGMILANPSTVFAAGALHSLVIRDKNKGRWSRRPLSFEYDPLVAVLDDRLALRLVMLFLDDSGSITRFIFLDDCRVAITITVAMVGTHGHTGTYRTHANADTRILRKSRSGQAKSSSSN